MKEHLGSAEHYALTTAPPSPELLMKQLKDIIIKHGRCYTKMTRWVQGHMINQGTADVAWIKGQFVTKETTRLTNHAAYILQQDKPVEKRTVVDKALKYCFFYLTVKLHKINKPPSTRPIVSNLGYPLYFASKYVHKGFFKIVKVLRTFFADSKQLIIMLESLPKTPGRPFWLMVADVTGMYPSIPITAESMEKIEAMVLKYGEKAGFDFGENNANLKFHMDILWFILNNCYLSYNEQVWRQISGTSMGTPCAVVFACLYVAWMEDKIMEKLRRTMTLAFILRFIDDYIGIAEVPGPNEAFVEDFNDPAFEPTMMLEAEYGKSVNFMDLNITKSLEGGFVFKAFEDKPVPTVLLQPPSPSFHRSREIRDQSLQDQQHARRRLRDQPPKAPC
jgi:hypothetical protein